MQPLSLFTVIILSLLHSLATAFVIPSDDTINNPDIPAANSNNLIISPNDQPSQFEVADFFGAPAQDTGNLKDGVGAAAAGILQLIRQGLDNAKPLPSIPDGPTVEKDREPVRTWGMERLAPGDQFCPSNWFGPRNKPVCDTGSLMDVQYIFFPVESWTLTFATIMYVPTMCPLVSLQAYWCCSEVENKVMGTIAKDCEPFDALNPQLQPLFRLRNFQPPGTDAKGE